MYSQHCLISIRFVEAPGLRLLWCGQTWQRPVQVNMTHDSTLPTLCEGNPRGQWYKAFIFSLLSFWANCWTNDRVAGDFRHRDANGPWKSIGMCYDNWSNYGRNWLLQKSNSSPKTGAGFVPNANIRRADPRFVPNQWETVLLCNDVSHWLGASLESALIYLSRAMSGKLPHAVCGYIKLHTPCLHQNVCYYLLCPSIWPVNDDEGPRECESF